MRTTVVIPTYNRAELLPAAVRSVLAQTRRPDEIIVVDDGSTDETPAVVAALVGEVGSTLRYERQANGGEPAARNRGVELATGDLVAFLDSDDVWYPEKLAHQLPLFDVPSPPSATFTAYDRVVDGRVDSTVRLDDWDPAAEAVIRRLLVGSCMPPSTVVLTRAAIIDAGWFQVGPPIGCDWMMWLRLARRGHRIEYLPEPLTGYLVHDAAMSRDERPIARVALQIVDEVFRDPSLPKGVRDEEARTRARWHLINAIQEVEAGDGRAGRRHLWQAARRSPRSVRPGWARLLASSLRSAGSADAHR